MVSARCRSLLFAVLTAATLAAAACGPEPHGGTGDETAGTSGTAVRDPASLVRTEGTERLFAPPADLRSGELVCQGDGERYVADMTAPVSRSDDEMETVGRCGSLDIPLYSPEGSGRDQRVYVKTAPHSYLRLRSE